MMRWPGGGDQFELRGACVDAGVAIEWHVDDPFVITFRRANSTIGKADDADDRSALRMKGSNSHEDDDV
jgi:hypothetical protein